MQVEFTPEAEQPGSWKAPANDNDDKWSGKWPRLSRIFGKAQTVPSASGIPFATITQAEAKVLLTRDLPKDARVNIRVDEDGGGRIEVTGDYINESRSFDMRKKTVSTGWFQITSDKLKGQGLGRKIMRNEIEFFRACGMKRFNIFAALDNGGYTWARVGFVPDSGEIDELRDTMRDQKKHVDALLSPEEKKQLDDILAFRSAKDIWRLADLRVDMAPRLRDVFSRAASGDRQARAQRETLRELDAADLSALKDGQAMPLGRLLMTGTSWHGHLDFHDAEQMKRVEEYCGGWKPAEKAAPRPLLTLLNLA